MRILLNLLLACTLALSPLAQAQPRLLSIGGTLTEILYALGAGEQLVGTDTSSYYPAAAETLPKVGYQRALAVEGILSLHPELVLASGEAGPATVLAQLRAAGVRVEVIDTPPTPAGLLSRIERLATLTGREQQGLALQQQISEQLQALQLPPQWHRPPKLLFILQHGNGSPMVAGRQTAVDELIHLSGALNAMADINGYKPLTPEALVQAAPDVILISQQGLAQSGGEAALLAQPGMALTPAGQQQRILSMDALLVLGMGPRTAEAALHLRSQLQAWFGG
ncbi:heme/hemin ABC transporter substrate-binding protein [Balneatrix alpica]|uniref:heme/hemin ABC transporter substrate-binding protein n=1 Tax=Balneatrix alpica TaxID=75684 RepID=UPI002739814A|nr:hemin ABC transporter substrate-binding protein [Balneatrix alpica]